MRSKQRSSAIELAAEMAGDFAIGNKANCDLNAIGFSCCCCCQCVCPGVCVCVCALCTITRPRKPKQQKVTRRKPKTKTKSMSVAKLKLQSKAKSQRSCSRGGRMREWRKVERSRGKRQESIGIGL